ncbi:glycosyltransferase family 2 protein [Paenibacillus thiaminolyticus]|uniref:glycosyltransferase family 2 protein n=1 Tax=Paenibacillus thiaminolyticus TaxID=49283 RepID=UPI0035A5CED9
MGDIVIFTDRERKIPYTEINRFYSVVYYKEPHADIRFKAVLCCIIDYKDPKRAIYASNIIRASMPEVALLIITEIGAALNDNDLIRIRGVGRISLIQWKENYRSKLLLEIQRLFHPEFLSEGPHTAFILSVYNEEERFKHVRRFCERLQAFIRTHLIEGSIYLIDDGSEDRTLEMLEGIERETNLTVGRINEDVIPLVNARKLGRNTRKAGTYLEGMRTIEADYFVFVDADDSFSIEDIARMINIVKMGYYDIIIGTKDNSAKNRSWLRFWISLCKRIVSKPFLPEGVIDSQTGLKVMSAVAVRRMFPHLKEEFGLAVDLEMMFIAKKLKLRVLQLPVECIDRDGSHIVVWRDSVRFVRSLVDIWRLDRRIK